MPHHPYPQPPPNIQQLLPSYVPPPLPPIPQTSQQFRDLSPPRPTQLPAQPIPNPNQRPNPPLGNLDMQNFPAYVISPAPISEIQLRSGKILEKLEPRVVIEEEDPVDPSEASPLRETIIPPTQASSSGLKGQI